MSQYPIATEAEVLRFLQTSNVDVDEALVSAINNKTIKFIDGEIMHTAEFSSAAGAKVELLTVGNTQRYGFSDFDGKKLDANTLMVFDGISFGYAEAATGNGAAVKYSNLESDIPADLAACILRIEQKGRVVLEQNVQNLLCHDVRVTNVGGASDTSSAYGFTQTKEDKVKRLRKFGYLVGNRETDIYLVAPNGETIQPSATLGHIRISLPGLKTMNSL